MSPSGGVNLHRLGKSRIFQQFICVGAVGVGDDEFVNRTSQNCGASVRPTLNPIGAPNRRALGLSAFVFGVLTISSEESFGRSRRLSEGRRPSHFRRHDEGSDSID
jgi:hypothetical protein